MSNSHLDDILKGNSHNGEHRAGPFKTFLYATGYCPAVVLWSLW